MCFLTLQYKNLFQQFYENYEMRSHLFLIQNRSCHPLFTVILSLINVTTLLRNIYIF